MLRGKNIVLSLFVLLCLAASAPAALAAPAAEGNFSRYVPETDYHEGMTREELEGAAHTIYWAQGIQPPAMPHTLEDEGSAPVKGSFRLIDGTNVLETPEQAGASREMFQYYIAPYQPDSGWYDVKKASYHDSNGEDANLDGVDDGSMCYAASSANLVQWWLDQNRDLVSRYVTLLKEHPELIPASPAVADPRGADGFYVRPGLGEEEGLMVRNNPVFRLMRQGFSHNKDGGFPDLAMDFFFNGYALSDPDGPPNGSGVNFLPDRRGGFFYPALGTRVISRRVSTAPSFSYANTMFRTWLTHGVGVDLGYLLNGSGHAITLWGAEYDEKGTLCAVYIVDNNDGAGDFGTVGGERHKLSMKRYRALNYDNKLMISGKRVTEPVGKGTGNIIYMLSLLDLGREPLEYFLEHHAMMPLPEGQKNYFPEDMAPPAYEYEDDHKHHYVCTANGNKIEQRCDVPDCGKVKGWIELVISDSDPFVYTGSRIEPKYRLYFKGNWDGGTNVRVFYEDNLHAGTGKIAFSINGQTGRAPFTIHPAPMPATDAVPELAEAPTPYSVTLRPLAGHEFSLDRESWQTEGLFDGLEPGKSYTFYVRRAASDADHSPALSPGVLTVTTPAGEKPEPSVWAIRSVTLENGRAGVTLSHTGQWEDADLMLAGYDAEGRLTGVFTRQILRGGALTEEQLMPSGTAEVRAFLTRNGAPLCRSESSLGR